MQWWSKKLNRIIPKFSMGGSWLACYGDSIMSLADWTWCGNSIGPFCCEIKEGCTSLTLVLCTCSPEFLFLPFFPGAILNNRQRNVYDQNY